MIKTLITTYNNTIKELADDLERFDDQYTQYDKGQLDAFKVVVEDLSRIETPHKTLADLYKCFDTPTLTKLHLIQAIDHEFGFLLDDNAVDILYKIYMDNPNYSDLYEFSSKIYIVAQEFNIDFETNQTNEKLLEELENY